ncbi:unnamed protein product, partial [Discosporangium mesarthrocarpum]
QVILCNPVCGVIYVVAASSFFRRRVPYEEALLTRFYPGEYAAYMGHTRIGIPFVR